jgi:hypothetical protein
VPKSGPVIPAAVSASVAEMQKRRVRLLGDVLQPVSEAATVEVRAGEVSVRRGPLVDAERQISGFNILECEDLDEALEVAGKHPVAAFGTLELRPFAES